ncbi:MAG: PAS domain-containing sensor histidine kinase [Promethearchaeota archaeon]
MVEFYVLQLVQAILYIGATVLFSYATLRRKDLKPWFFVYISTASAISLNYIAVLNPNIDFLRILTNLLYFIAHFLIFSASLIELKRLKPDLFKFRGDNRITSLFIFFLFQASGVVIILTLEILMILLMVMSISIMFYVFNHSKFAIHALILLAMCITLIITLNNYFEDANLSYSEELSPALSIFLGSVLLVAALIAPLEEKLTNSEQKYRHLFESSPFPILLMDFNGRLVDMNPACEQMFLFKKEEVLGENFEDMGILPIKSLIDVIKKLHEKAPSFHFPPIEIELTKKDGTSFWVHWQGSIVSKDSIDLIEFIGHDISERAKIEQLRIEEMEKLKELDNIRKDLLTRVTHELKTPLMTIRGASEFLQSQFGEQVGPEGLSLLEMIERGGVRLEKLVSNLIDISRIEYKKLELSFEKCNFYELVKEAIEEFEHKIKERQVSVKIEGPKDIIVKLDRIRMMQVITNLLSNALKNSRPRSEILIRLEKEKDWINFIIKDYGVGLTKEEMSRLFTRFGKIERHEEGIEYIDIQGSGLGLYIAKQMVEMHKGQIYVYSDGRNRGATFQIRLPVKEKIIFSLT